MGIELDFWETKTYERVVVDGVRHYDIDGNLYRSVTSVTSAYSNAGIEKWKKRVGVEEAEKISNKATTHGTLIHEMCEDYILGRVVDRNPSFSQRMIFNNFKRVLNNISAVHLLENTLYSHKLRLAGTVDCVGIYDGVLSIIDFKTAKTEKPAEWIESYIVQTTIYAMMVYEMYGIKIQQIVLLFACKDLTNPVVIKKIDKDMLELVKLYINNFRYGDKKGTQSVDRY